MATILIKLPNNITCEKQFWIKKKLMYTDIVAFNTARNETISE